MKNVYVYFGSQSGVMIKNGSTGITKTCYVDYGSCSKVTIKKGF